MKPEQFDHFEIFADLDPQSKLVAAKLMTLHTVKKKTCLFEVGENDDTEYFLCEGEIDLVAADGISKHIVAGDSAAHFPLALLRPRKFTAKVSSKTASVIKIDVATLQKLRKTVPVAGDAFSSFMPFSDEVNSVTNQQADLSAIKDFLLSAIKAIVENRVNIANFDDVSAMILRVTQDPDVSLDTITSAVQLDPAIAAKLLKAANSAFYGGMGKVDSVRAAVVRLGLSLTVQLVTLMVLKEVFSSEKESLENAMHNLWQSSLQLATFSVVIGKRSSTKFDQGACLLAGLMNEIGTLVIIAYLDQFPGMMINISEYVFSSARVKKRLGKELLSHWQFPQAIIDVAANSDKYDRQVESADMVDVVCMARMLIRMTSYRKEPIAEIADLPAFHRLGFDEKSPGFINEILEEARQYIQLFTGVSE